MRKFKFGLVALVAMSVMELVVGCSSVEVAQYGIESDNTIALNITKDPNVGNVVVTHVNGEATGGYVKRNFLFGTYSAKLITPLYVKLTDKPIIFTVQCPVIVGYKSSGEPNVQYRATEIRLTKLSDLKAGDVLTLRWMYQTQTFAFLDATGNIVQQIIPIFN